MGNNEIFKDKLLEIKELKLRSYILIYIYKMGFEKLVGFLSRNLSYGCMEDLSLRKSLKKVLANHVFFDLNFIIYYCVLELENEINDILKIIYNLPFNYNNKLEEKIENIFKKKYWKKCNFTIEKILDGTSEKNIVDKFKTFLESKVTNNIPVVFKVLYWKIFYKLCEWIENYHHIKFVDSINIFLDGIPSYSKILEQRRRRSKNFLEANIRKKNFEDKFDSMYNDILEEGDIKYNYFNWLYSKFSINKSIGPTSLLTIELEKFLEDKLKNYFTSVEININSGVNYGESDNKIFSHIHKRNLENDIVIHTCDSDLVHQIITQQCYFNIKQKNVFLSVIRYHTRDEKSVQLIEAKNIIKLLLKKYNDCIKNKNVEKINYFHILDLMVILCFFGNDHIPSSLELGCEINLNYYFMSHNNVYLKHGNVINLIDGKLKLNIYTLSKWLEEVRNSKTFTLIILNRFYKLPYNLIHFLVDRLKLRLDNLVKDFLIPFFIYEGYYNIEIEKNKLVKEDLRFKYYTDFRKSNKDIPINPLETNTLPDNFKKQYKGIRTNLLKFIDFFNYDNYGLQVNDKIQLIDENSYQDLYKYIFRNTANESQKLYEKFYKPYPYTICDIDKYSDYLNKDNIEEYIRFLYYYVDVYMNDMSDYNPCNFIYFSGFTTPSLESLINFIQKNNINDLYKRWDKYIKDNNTVVEKYFDSVSHHLFITPYLKSSQYISKIKNIPKLARILEKLEEKEGCLWFLDDENKNLNYRNIHPKLFLKNWVEVIADIYEDKKEDVKLLNIDNNNFDLTEISQE